MKIVRSPLNPQSPPMTDEELELLAGEPVVRGNDDDPCPCGDCTEPDFGFSPCGHCKPLRDWESRNGIRN